MPSTKSVYLNRYFLSDIYTPEGIFIPISDTQEVLFHIFLVRLFHNGEWAFDNVKLLPI